MLCSISSLFLNLNKLHQVAHTLSSVLVDLISSDFECNAHLSVSSTVRFKSPALGGNCMASISVQKSLALTHYCHQCFETKCTPSHPSFLKCFQEWRCVSVAEFVGSSCCDIKPEPIIVWYMYFICITIKYIIFYLLILYMYVHTLLLYLYESALLLCALFYLVELPIF